MKISKCRSLWLLAGLCTVFVFSVNTSSERLPLAQAEVVGYKKWARVNSTPTKLEATISALCAPANTGKQIISPHKDKFITVYVNATGQPAMTSERYPQFPQGSVIIKEKLPTETSMNPELLTVMIKREKGFNEQSNDWEFLVLSGDAKEVIERGKLETCAACHASQRGSDFVFRNYLTAADWERMK